MLNLGENTLGSCAQSIESMACGESDSSFFSNYAKKEYAVQANIAKRGPVLWSSVVIFKSRRVNAKRDIQRDAIPLCQVRTASATFRRQRKAIWRPTGSGRVSSKADVIRSCRLREVRAFGSVVVGSKGLIVSRTDLSPPCSSSQSNG